MVKSNYHSESKICISCGKEIPNPNKTYCSRECYLNTRDPTRPKTLEGTCINCGKTFTVDKRYRYQLKTKKFCSHECSEAYYSGERHHNYVPKVKLNCKICGKEYEVIPYLSDKLKTCRDPDCYKEWMSRSFSGANHPLWQGGLSFEPYCPKFNRSFKERVRAYFNNRCVQCGTPENGEKLHVHHVHYNKTSCCDPNVPKMFVPLCRSCHSKTTHGNREEWREQFEQLIISYYGGRSYYTQEEWDKLKGITPAPVT